MELIVCSELSLVHTHGQSLSPTLFFLFCGLVCVVSIFIPVWLLLITGRRSVVV